ncbi:CHAT domain-containing protein [Thermosynechococcus sp.]|uniref:CHAT domain-containing protein n=1 Tax=Thermosynechococcus sp. TaxID=2814275 RepID=UPI0039199C97
MLNKLARCVAKAVPCWLFGMVGFTSSVLTAPAVAQITPAANATGTTVEVVNQQFNIGGGRLSGDGQNLFHLFQHFNIHQGQTANFLSSPQIRNILAGVNGGYASYVNGVLQVTGGNSNLYLLNPAGIVFGPNAQLNLPAAFHASTAQRVHFGNGIFDLNGLNSYSQLNSSPLGFEFANKGIVINEGNLRVNSGQSLTLMAHQVINTGTLGAAGGTVNVVAVPDAGLVRVSQEGMLLSLEIPQERLPATGIIQPVDLPTLLTGGNGYPAVNSVIQHPDGTIRLVHDSTKIPLTTNTAVIGGTLDVSHTTGAGGKITVAGQGSNVALLNAQLTAAGNTGGGTILVGGDYLGGTTGTNRLDRSFNAKNLFVNSVTFLDANSLGQGSGGVVINWADNNNNFYGRITARGGPQGGNGGFVEVSGKNYLDFQGVVDTTAPKGNTGILLLDPTDIVISTFDSNITLTSPFEASPSSSSLSYLSIGTLLSALDSSNVIVTTASNGSASGTILISQNIFSSSPYSLTLIANYNINLPRIISLAGDLNLRAGNLINTDLATGSELTARNITITGNIFDDQYFSDNGLKIFGREVTINGDIDAKSLRIVTRGNVSINGDVRTRGDIYIDSYDLSEFDSYVDTVNTRNLQTTQGNILISAGRVSTGNLFTGGGWVGIIALEDSLTTSNISTSGGKVDLFAPQINTGSIQGNPIYIERQTLRSGSKFQAWSRVISQYSVSTTFIRLLSDLIEGTASAGSPLVISLREREVAAILEPRPSIPETLLENPSSEVAQSTPVVTSTEVQAAIDNNNLMQAITLLEQKSCADIAAYLGSACGAKELSLKDSQAILNEISKQTGKKPAITYTLARPNQLDLLVVTPEGQPIYASSPVGREQLLQTVETFTNSIRDPRLINTRAYLATAQQLYQWMIAPLRAELDAQGIDTLTFVLDAGMRAIPIAALHDGSGFLVERFSLGLMPSLSLVDTRYRPLQGQRVLAMGGSEFVDLSPLPAVPVELEQVTQALGGGSKFLNEDFTLSNLQQEHRRGVYPVIHLATHGEFQPGAPQNSYLAFQDRRLTLPELRQLRLYRPQTELLTLSACRTAVGDLDAELGFAGLSVQSGAKSVLASLWYVSDEGTLALMTEFYNQLSKVPIKAEALRQAQLAMLRGEVAVKGNELRTIRGGIPLPPEVVKEGGDRSLDHPYFWAAFTMIGSPW